MCLGIFASIDVLNFVLIGEEAFVGEGNTFYLGFFSNFFPGEFFTREDTRLLVGVNEGEGVRFTVEARGERLPTPPAEDFPQRLIWTIPCDSAASGRETKGYL